eukprot:ANDGO_03369.mRNA.1 hypothetical protein
MSNSSLDSFDFVGFDEISSLAFSALFGQPSDITAVNIPSSDIPPPALFLAPESVSFSDPAPLPHPVASAFEPYTQPSVLCDIQRNGQHQHQANNNSNSSSSSNNSNGGDGGGDDNNDTDNDNNDHRCSVGESTGANIKKKRRVSKACAECRSLKQSCDGNGSDPCSRCIHRRVAHLCVYLERKRSSRSSCHSSKSSTENTDLLEKVQEEPVHGFQDDQELLIFPSVPQLSSAPFPFSSPPQVHVLQPLPLQEKERAEKEDGGDGFVQGYSETRVSKRPKYSASAVATCSPHSNSLVAREDLVARATIAWTTFRSLDRGTRQRFLRVIPRLDDECLRCMSMEGFRVSKDQDMQFVLTHDLDQVVQYDAGFRSNYLRAVQHVTTSSFPSVIVDKQGKVAVFNSPAVQETPVTREEFENSEVAMDGMIDADMDYMCKSISRIIISDCDRSVSNTVVPVAVRTKGGAIVQMLGAISYLRTSQTAFTAAVSIEFIPLPIGFSFAPS